MADNTGKMTITQYRQKTRQAIVLPSGLNVSIRKLIVSDFIELGTIPQAFLDGTITEKEVTQNPALVAQLCKAVLLNCVLLIDGGIIVDKHPSQCSGEELSYSEITQADVDAIMAVANGQSLPGKEAVEASKPFSEKPKTT